MNDREKLVELLDNFHRDLSPFAGNDKLFVVDDNIEQAEYLIANGVTVQRWIPVTERLPEVYQPCLCYKRAHGEDGYRLGIYLGASFSEKCAAFKSMSHYGCIGATHWMPLPEPPKEE